MKYDKIPDSTFKEIQLGAGVLLDSFDPATGSIISANIIGATSGGVTFEATPSFVDFGEGIDNCPANMLELKKLDSWEAKLSGSFVTISTSIVSKLLASSDIDGNKITPKNNITKSDFRDIWWVGDYSDVTTGEGAGFIAIHMINSLSTGGFKAKSASNEKGGFDFEFTGHYSMEAQDVVPFEIYVKAGE